MVGVGPLPLGERKCASVVSSHIGVSTQQGGGHLKVQATALVVLRGGPLGWCKQWMGVSSIDGCRQRHGFGWRITGF